MPQRVREDQEDRELEMVGAELDGVELEATQVDSGDQNTQFMPRVFDVDSLDIPAFLRRR